MQIVLLRGYSARSDFQIAEMNSPYRGDPRGNGSGALSTSAEEAVNEIIEAFMPAAATAPPSIGLVPSRLRPVSSLVHPESEHDKYRMTALNYAAVVNGTFVRYPNVTSDFMFEHFLDSWPHFRGSSEQSFYQILEAGWKRSAFWLKK